MCFPGNGGGHDTGEEDTGGADGAGAGVGSGRGAGRDNLKTYTAPPGVEDLEADLTGAPPPTEGKRTRRQVVFDSPAEEPKAKTVALPIQFARNADAITPESRPFVESVGQLLRRNETLRLVIEGHTDAKGSDSHNLVLSQRRAEAVKRFLVATHDIDPGRLITEGKGEAEPLIPADPLDARNRRVQFRVAAPTSVAAAPPRAAPAPKPQAPSAQAAAPTPAPHAPACGNGCRGAAGTGAKRPSGWKARDGAGAAGSTHRPRFQPG